MPAGDLSDLKDVVDAINRLCDTMRTSDYEDELYEDCATADEPVDAVEAGRVSCSPELVGPEQVTVRTVETYQAERWGEVPAEEPPSEMYYTASSEVSLLSELELPEPRRECVMSGHVAAMRERFESMTRANTPCPEPDVLRNITPSPDLLG